MRHWVLFDWGDTLMRTLDFPGPMCSWPKVEAIPGAASMMRGLHGQIGIALATNAADSEDTEIWKALELVGLDAYVQRIFCFKSVGHKKSSPPFFAHVMNELQLAAGHLVMVGDDFEQDVVASNAVGIKAIWFNEKTQENRDGGLFKTVHTLGDIPPLLESWDLLEARKA